MSKKFAYNDLHLPVLIKDLPMDNIVPCVDERLLVCIVDKGIVEDYQPYLGYLRADEQCKADQFRFSSDRANFILGKGILRILLGHYLNLDPREVLFKTGKYGKPELAVPANLSFNISHSEDIIALGFSKDCSIWIDVEKIKTDFDVMELAAQYFSKKEIASLTSIAVSDRKRAFFRCWTRKESIIKAKGKGLSHALDTFSVTIDRDDEAELLEMQWPPRARERWDLYSFVPSPGYIGAVAVDKKVKKVEYLNWDASLMG